MNVFISKADLFLAFEANSMDTLYYLNIKDGSFEVEIDNTAFGLDEDEDDNDVDVEFGTWIQIPVEDSSVGYNRMVSFIESLPNSKLKNQLSYAISKNKPFRRFKDVLLNYPQERELFFDFENSEREKNALSFIEDLEERFGIEIELK